MNPTSETQATSDKQQKQGGLTNDSEKLTSITSVEESEKQLSPTQQIEENHSSPNNNITSEAIALSHVSLEEKVGRALGTSSASSSKASQSKKVEWEKNWHCLPRKRSDGKLDKYYYLKEPPHTLCRSLVEVAKFESSRAQGTQDVKECADEGTAKPSSNRKRGCKFWGAEGESSTKRRGGSLIGSEQEKFVSEFLADAWERQQCGRYGIISQGEEAQQKHSEREFVIEDKSGGDEENATQALNLNDLYNMMARQYASLATRMEGLEAMLNDVLELLRHKNDEQNA